MQLDFTSLLLSVEERACNKCGQTKPLSEFYKGEARCKVCRRLEVRATYAANRERYRAADFEYRRRPEVQSSRAAYSKEWSAQNQDKKALYKKRIRALRQASPERFTPRQFRELCAQYGNACLCCGAATKLTPDHIVPITRGGSDSIENIQPLCMKCNRAKYLDSTDYRKIIPTS